jgi:predicted AAA+ superfamily ATPase
MDRKFKVAMHFKEQIIEALKATEGLYYRLVLLVGEAGAGKTSLLQTLAQELETEVININLALSTELLELSTKQRALALPERLAQVVEKTKPLLLLDNLEILFDKHLQQDALKLLQGLSRNNTVLASWNGKISGDKLIYADPGHPEYQSYDLKDLLIVNINNA